MMSFKVRSRHQFFFGTMKSKIIKYGAFDRYEEEGCAYTILGRNMKEKDHFECLGIDGRINIKINFMSVGGGGVD